MMQFVENVLLFFVQSWVDDLLQSNHNRLWELITWGLVLNCYGLRQFN